MLRRGYLLPRIGIRTLHAQRQSPAAFLIPSGEAVDTGTGCRSGALKDRCPAGRSGEPQRTLRVDCTSAPASARPFRRCSTGLLHRAVGCSPWTAPGTSLCLASRLPKGLRTSSSQAAGSGAPSARSSLSRSDAHKSCSDGPVSGVDYFAAIAALSCALSSLFLSAIVCNELCAFSGSPVCEGSTFSTYLWYHFSEWFSTSRVARVVVVFMLVQGLCLSSSFAYAVAVQTSLTTGFRRCWGWIVSPDGGGSERSASGRLVGAATSIGGVVIFALLVSMITETFARKMQEIQSGQSRIIEANHTDKSPEIVKELAISGESEGGYCIAVLDQRPLNELRKAVDMDLQGVDLKGTTVVVRSGHPFVKADLQKVAAEHSKAIVIQHDPSMPEAEADAVAMRKVASLKGFGWPKNGFIVVHAVDQANESMFQRFFQERLLGMRNVTVMVFDHLVAQVMTQCSRQKGLSSVYDDSFSFEGHEIYHAKWDVLTGRTFQEVVFSFEDAVPIGVVTSSGACHLAPPSSYVVKENDSIIVYAEDNSTYKPSESCAVDFPAWCQQNPCSFRAGKDTTLKRENILIIGWNAAIKHLLVDLQRTSLKGSTFTLLSKKPVSERKAELTSFEQRLGKSNIPGLKLKHIVGSPVVRKDLAALPLANYDAIFILSEPEAWAIGPSWETASRIAADGMTVASYFLIHDILKESRTEHVPRIIPEVLEERTTVMLRQHGVDDIINSNRLVSLILASVSEDPHVGNIIKELISSTTTGIQMRSIENYLPKDAMIPDSLSFWDVMCLVRRVSDDCVIGWSLQQADHEAMKCMLNPPNKRSKIKWNSQNKLVVVS
eukprot:TRINITY_DN27020_c0_g1_i1.p1 TRINITY_DN27020_c0_g1~~TRINITY_DN27020_c0_g1_i1.p1  ORF type:complete len:833 (+),score=133.92 TRINITY_DN27020_c0_g1_i1:84-2582(+)